MICCTKLRYRLDNVYKDVCWYKWLFWMCELVMVPMMFNVAWLGNCKFYSQRDAVTMANCMQDGNHWPNILIICMSVMFVIVFAYNCVLWYIIQSAKISTEFHEYQIRKKEIEAILGINLLWRVNKFWTFSSFKSGVMAMYHRVYFNLLAMLMVLMEVGMVSICKFNICF